MEVMKIAPVASVVLATFAIPAFGQEVRASCTGVSGNTACELSAELAWDVHISDGMSARIAPIIHFAPSVSGAAFADDAYGKTLSFREAYVSFAFGSTDVYAGVRKFGEAVRFDFAAFQPGLRFDGREPFASLRMEHVLGTPQVAVAHGSGEVRTEVAVVGTSASTLPGKESPWSAYPENASLSNPDSGNTGVVGSVSWKYSDARIAIMAGHTASNSVTDLHVQAESVRPRFAMDDLIAIVGEKEFDPVTIRAGFAHHDRSGGESFSRVITEVENVREYVDGGNSYLSVGYAHVWQSDRGSAFDLNRALVDHILIRAEYETAGGTIIGGTLTHGVHDDSGYLEAEVRVPVSVGAKPAEIGARVFRVRGGDGSGPATAFDTYAGKHGAVLAISFKF